MTRAPVTDAFLDAMQYEADPLGDAAIARLLAPWSAVPEANEPQWQRLALVKAYVVLAPGFEASEALVAELQQHVRGKLAPYEYPKEIEFIDALPMTTTGKVQRRVLRLQEEARAAQRDAGPR